MFLKLSSDCLIVVQVHIILSLELFISLFKVIDISQEVFLFLPIFFMKEFILFSYFFELRLKFKDFFVALLWL